MHEWLQAQGLPTHTAEAIDTAAALSAYCLQRVEEAKGWSMARKEAREQKRRPGGASEMEEMELKQGEQAAACVLKSLKWLEDHCGAVYGAHHK